MNYERIVEEIKAAGIEAELKEVVKGSTKLMGIQLGEGKVRPVIYPERSNAEGTDEEIAQAIIRKYKEQESVNIDPEGIITYEYIKENMLVALRKPVDDGAFRKSFADLEMVLRVKVDLKDGTYGTYVIQEQLASAVGINEDVFEDVIKATTYTHKPLSQVIAEMMGMPANEVPEGEDMYVLTNTDNKYGASAMCNVELLETLAEKLGNNLVVIPSSTEEVLVIKYTDSVDLDELRELIISVNGDQVTPEEQLSDHAYIYLKGSKQITW